VNTLTVYVDDAAIMYRSKLRYHLIADSLAELHAFCKTVGINRCWFHNARGHPHYDVTGPQREAAIAAGAIPITDRELLYRTESGRRSLNRRIAESVNDPEEHAKWLALVPPGESAIKPKQEELF
jgi:hypothetical protein